MSHYFVQWIWNSKRNVLHFTFDCVPLNKAICMSTNSLLSWVITIHYPSYSWWPHMLPLNINEQKSKINCLEDQSLQKVHRAVQTPELPVLRYLEFVLQKQLHGFAFTEQSFPLQREPENRVKGTSPKSPTSALNESLVECPNCSIQYPANEHRDLLVHVEYCTK